MTIGEHQNALQQEAAEALAMGELMLEGSEEVAHLASRTEVSGKKQTPVASRRDSLAGSESTPGQGGGSAKRRGRPRGWTDARIHQMLAYLERNMVAYRSMPAAEFYAGLCMSLGYDMSEAAEIQDKCDKMIKKFENDTRRGDISWKWYARLNQVFGGPALAPYAGFGGRLMDDDAASSSLDSAEEDETGEGGEPLRRRARGEDQYQDRLVHEKLLLKLKKLKSKTEMRHRDWEAAMEKQRAAYEELKNKTAASIARLEKSIVNAGYELEQSDMLVEPQL